MSSEATKPVEEIRMGAVKATIWKNMVDQGNNSRPIYNVSFQRLYRDAESKWQSSGSFGRDDLLVLAQIAERTFARVYELQQTERTTELHQ
jgi:hypothetical protein